MAVECEELGPHHLSEPAYIKDIIKYNKAASLGWIVLRCTDVTVQDGEIYESIIDVLCNKGCQLTLDYDYNKNENHLKYKGMKKK